ncbi:hypothetical protein [Haemophilus parahaemolyticus]|uniref:hypothetical protein n=2 Tax=Haemophilus TaxID=724 RepID=UPI00288B0813|nr:hypothetical protein [Haemophilus parahaemolyticus]
MRFFIEMMNMCEQNKSLSETDKNDIKQAILKAVENGNTDPENLVCRLINAIERVNKYNSRVVSGICGVDSQGSAISSSS